jgi:hypothetical protein
LFSLEVLRIGDKDLLLAASSHGRKKHASLVNIERRGGRVLLGAASAPNRSLGVLEKKFAEILAILEFRTLDVGGDFSFGPPRKRTDRAW